MLIKRLEVVNKFRFRPHKVYILLIGITSRVDLAMPVCLSVRMNADISETTKARKFVSAGCHDQQSRQTAQMLEK